MKRIISGILIQFAVISSVFAAPFTPYQVLTATALNAAIAAPNITGGTIDAAPIGVTTPSSGNFTTLATGSLTASGAISGASISGAGTGLTGTAAGLNVGGYAATANSSPAIGLTGTTIAPSVVNSSLTTAAGGAFGSGAYVSAVTTIGVTTSNGVSGTSSGGTTPSLTIALGAITPTSINGVTTDNSANKVLTGNERAAGVPTGALNGSNQTYTLPQTPKVSVPVYINGLFVVLGVDYSLTSATITHIGTALSSTE